MPSCVLPFAARSIVLGDCDGSMVYSALRKTCLPKYVVVWVAVVTRRAVFTIEGSSAWPACQALTISHSPTSSPSPDAVSTGGEPASTAPRVNTSTALPLPGLVAKERGRSLPLMLRQIFQVS